MRLFIYTASLLVCFFACSRQSKTDQQIQSKTDTSDYSRDSVMVKTDRIIPELKSMPIQFDFVLNQPELIYRDMGGSDHVEPMNAKIRVVSDTAKKVVIVYYDEILTYQFNNVSYPYSSDSVRKIKAIGYDYSIIELELFHGRGRDYITIGVGKTQIISAEGDFRIND